MQNVVFHEVEAAIAARRVQDAVAADGLAAGEQNARRTIIIACSSSTWSGSPVST